MRAAFALALLLATGCYASIPEGSPGEAKCPFGPDLAYDPSTPYPFCQWETSAGFERYCPRSFDGWGYSNWHTATDGSAALCHDSAGDCNTCFCFLGCTVGAAIPVGPDGGLPAGPCPAPASGTALATCVPGGGSGTFGTCFLFCDHDERCPDGMRCVLDPLADEGPTAGHHLCAWAVGNDRCSL